MLRQSIVEVRVIGGQKLVERRTLKRDVAEPRAASERMALSSGGSTLGKSVGSGCSVSIARRLSLSGKIVQTNERARSSRSNRRACSFSAAVVVSAPLSALASRVGSGVLLHRKYDSREASS